MMGSGQRLVEGYCDGGQYSYRVSAPWSKFIAYTCSRKKIMKWIERRKSKFYYYFGNILFKFRHVSRYTKYIG